MLSGAGFPGLILSSFLGLGRKSTFFPKKTYHGGRFRALKEETPWVSGEKVLVSGVSNPRTVCSDMWTWSFYFNEIRKKRGVQIQALIFVNKKSTKKTEV